jgi:acetyl esterase/lipase
VLTGGSAGAHLAALAGLTPGRSEWQPGFDLSDTRVSGVIALYGVYDLLDRNGLPRCEYRNRVLARYIMPGARDDARDGWDLASPISHVSSAAPPFFVVHGTHDAVVPVDEARAFVGTLRHVSQQPVAYAEIPGAVHAFDVWHSPWCDAAIAAIHRFAELCRARHTGSTAQRS